MLKNFQLRIFNCLAYFFKLLLTFIIMAYIIINVDARVAQLVEHDLAKVGVAGSSPVSRFLKPLILRGFRDIGNHEVIKKVIRRMFGYLFYFACNSGMPLTRSDFLSMLFLFLW